MWNLRKSREMMKMRKVWGLPGRNLIGRNLTVKNLTGRNLTGKNLTVKNLIGRNLTVENDHSLRLSMVIILTATIHALEKAIIHILRSHIDHRLHFAVVHHDMATDRHMDPHHTVVALRIMALQHMVLRIAIHQKVPLGDVHHLRHMMVRPKALPVSLQGLHQAVIP
jgi:hypothetical protein